MSEALLRTDKEITDIYMRHVKTVYRVCFAYMKNKSDTEDAVEISYTVEYNDGTTRNISVMHPYIIVDGTAYYSTTEDISVFTDYAEHLKSKQ